MSTENQPQKVLPFREQVNNIEKMLGVCTQRGNFAYNDKIAIFYCHTLGDFPAVQKAFCLIDGAEFGTSIERWEVQPEVVGISSITISEQNQRSSIWAKNICAYPKSSFTEADALAYGKELLEQKTSVKN